jgi:AcrR family transcriptional regulator
MSEARVRDDTDEVRERLLEAAAQVFARKGYEGTKILDIVRQAGLSTGAVYGRFSSKDELLKEAVVGTASRAARIGDHPDMRVADIIASASVIPSGPLTDRDAVRLEAAVAARRHPEVASALADAEADLRERVQHLVDAAVDPEAVLYFVRTLKLGLLAQRAAGAAAPEPVAWRDLIDRVVASFGDAQPNPTVDAIPRIDPGAK